MVPKNLSIRVPRAAALAALLIGTPLTAHAEHSPIKSDEQVIFFPTVGRVEPDGRRIVPFHGWIFEPEVGSVRRKMLIESLCRSLSLVAERCNSTVFQSRARFFLADNESGKRVPVRLGDVQGIAAASGSEGHFRGELTLQPSDTPLVGHQQWLLYRAITRPSDPRAFEGKVLVLEPTGISVVSDVDDTLKVSNVLDRKELLLNSFVRPFQPVEGMAELYRAWAGEGAAFHYLSASPWQLYPALQEFADGAKFPLGSFHMKEFRWKDTRFFDLFISPDRFKLPILESFIGEFPNRRFVLVGDSGEQDPEIYGSIARKFPKQDIRIVIRELGGSPVADTRRQRAFKDVPLERYKIVNDLTLRDPGGREMLTEFVAR